MSRGRFGVVLVSLLVTLSTVSCQVPDCSSYVILNQRWRSLNFTRGTELHCDRDGWVTQWYRFSGAAGTKMPNLCDPTQHCGTHAPVWINGTYPAPEDGAVDRQACAHWPGDCCRWSMKVRVRNCGGVFLYYLPTTSDCWLAYCGEY
ncbi:oncoprotein-induced transcript 3 protein [Lingula anatina]|uniref:Oncoprotein-induced transcript 3 protein n=1 Tax=Lingula anatina TaxID=7574 RepID=A0A1S3K8A6_LINAN|nr:oncoprotein-induced transcript 3 protein [Lingula anatina]|eukprot:XP_013418858.1 oncoprotein-induced transcript 3 protein [Lingula anatina]